MMHNRWLVLLVVFLARISMGFQFQSVASVAPFIVEDLSLSYAQLGWLIGLFSLPGVLAAVPGGILGLRFGERRVAVLSLALMAAGGLVTAWGPDFLVASVGRAVSGVGAILLNLAFSKIVADWFAEKEIATAMGVMLTAWPVGMALGLISIGVVAQNNSWRRGMELTVLAALLSLLLIVLLYRDPPSANRRPSEGAAHSGFWLSRVEWKLALIAGLAWAALNAALFVFVSFAPGVLIAGGVSVGPAGVVVSLALWTTLVSMPLGGYLADRVKQRDRLIVLSSLAAAGCMGAYATLPMPWLWCVLGGLVLGPAPGGIMALLPGTLRPDRLSIAFGIYYSVLYAGVAVAQPLAGLFLDISGHPAMPVWFAAVLMLLVVVGLAVFRRVQKSTSVPASA